MRGPLGETLFSCTAAADAQPGRLAPTHADGTGSWYPLTYADGTGGRHTCSYDGVDPGSSRDRGAGHKQQAAGRGGCGRLSAEALSVRWHCASGLHAWQKHLPKYRLFRVERSAACSTGHAWHCINIRTGVVGNASDSVRVGKKAKAECEEHIAPISDL